MCVGVGMGRSSDADAGRERAAWFLDARGPWSILLEDVKLLRGRGKKKKHGVREARTLDLRITQISYETYALANCATTPLMPGQPIFPET